MRQSWSKERICEKIRELHESGERLNSNHIQLHRQTLYAAAIKYFDGWEKAIEAAGLTYSRIRVRKPTRSWNASSIVQALRKRHAENFPISGFAVYQQDRGLWMAARRHFGKGGWTKALKVAGFDARDLDPRRIWTRPRVLAEIFALQITGSPMYAYYLMRNGHSGLVRGGKKVFGSWRKAIEAADLNYDKIRANRYKWWNKDRVVEEIKRLEKRGVKLSSTFIHRFHGDLFAAAIVHCGSWVEAVTIAGINYRSHYRVWSSKAWLRSQNSETISEIEQRIAIPIRKHRRTR